MRFISRFFGRRGESARHLAASAAKERVTFDAQGVRRTMANGTEESVAWDELQEVFILTTDEGPFSEDVYWVLSGNGKGCAVPGGAEGMKELLARLQALQGFNNEAVVQAMGSTSNAKFVCWSRANAL
jgi:hypothetical protein